MKTRTDRQIWKEDYVDPMFKKYKSVPTKLKYMFIEKDYIKMFGKNLAIYHLNIMTDKCEDFIFVFENALHSFSKTVKKNLLNKYFEDLALYEHSELLKSGMFWEFFPNLTGGYLQDKEFFLNFIIERESKKEYVKLILE